MQPIAIAPECGAAALTRDELQACLDTVHALVEAVASGRGVSDFERAQVAAIRPRLGDLFRWSAAMAVMPQRAPSPTDVAEDTALTSREREVLRWVAAGKTDRDIADILDISPRTVHKHLQAIYRKLGVETRTAAVMRASRPPVAAFGLGA